MIAVTNVTRRAAVFNLPHDVVCKSRCSCTPHVHRQADHNPETGDVGYRFLESKLSGSAHIQPGVTVTLPDEAERAPEIVSARARGEVRVEKVQAPAPQPQPAPKSAA